MLSSFPEVKVHLLRWVLYCPLVMIFDTLTRMQKLILFQMHNSGIENNFVHFFYYQIHRRKTMGDLTDDNKFLCRKNIWTMRITTITRVLLPEYDSWFRLRGNSIKIMCRLLAWTYDVGDIVNFGIMHYIIIITDWLEEGKFYLKLSKYLHFFLPNLLSLFDTWIQCGLSLKVLANCQQGIKTIMFTRTR